MTTTAILSAVASGTSTNVGNLFNPVKTTLQTATTAVKISARYTFGAGTTLQPSSVIRVCHAVSPVSYASATVGALALRGSADVVEIPVNANTSLDHERPSDVLVTAAGYHYCWVEMPTLSAAGALTVNLQELP